MGAIGTLVRDRKTSLVLGLLALCPVFSRERNVELCEFRVSLVYTEFQARATNLRSCLKKKEEEGGKEEEEEERKEGKKEEKDIARNL